MENLDFSRPLRFYRGNLHTHSTRSDGLFPPDQVCRAYRRAGYDFLAISDHFMEVYGFRLTDTRPWHSEGFTTLIAAELHAPHTALGERWHIEAVGLPLDFPPLRAGETGPQIARRAHDAGAFIGIVHPSWSGLVRDDAHRLPFAHGVEIYNHSSAVEVDRGNSWPFLEALLNEGWRLSGYAADDAHELAHDWLGGWVMVQAEANAPGPLLEALKAGRYYSSQGPLLHDIAFGGGRIAVRCSPAATVAVQGRGSRSWSARGEGLESADFDLRPFEGSWLRVTVIDGQGRRAWSNPYWLD